MKNIREPITSAIGFTIIVITIIGLHRDQIDWQWDGVIGVCVGAMFFMMPDKILNLILDTLKKATDKYLGNNEQKQDS
jgi:hypothetical protein